MSTEDKLQAFEQLMDEASSALADLVAVLKDRSEDDAVSSALADLAAALEKRSATDLAPVVDAIKALRIAPPAVNVTVEPVIHVAMRSALSDGATIEMRMPMPGGRDKVILLRQLPPT